MPAPQCSTQSALNGFTHQQVHAGDAQEQHGAFESNGTVMQLVEFHSPRIRFRRVLHRHHFFPERFHSVAYAELRRGGEQHHQHDAESRSIRKAPEIVRAGQPGNQKDNSQKNSRKVQPRQRKTHHHSRGIAIPKNRKRAGSYHKTEKSDRPQPQAQTQKLNRSKKSCHEGFRLLCISSSIVSKASSRNLSMRFVSSCRCFSFPNCFIHGFPTGEPASRNFCSTASVTNC